MHPEGHSCTIVKATTIAPVPRSVNDPGQSATQSTKRSALTTATPGRDATWATCAHGHRLAEKNADWAHHIDRTMLHWRQAAGLASPKHVTTARHPRCLASGRNAGHSANHTNPTILTTHWSARTCADRPRQDLPHSTSFLLRQVPFTLECVT